jgi:hypothetical protein
MSADPRQRQLARFSSLYARSVIAIEKGGRSEAMIEAVLKALQRFKENRLGGVVSLQPGEEKLPGNFQELLSMRMNDVPFKVRGALRFFDDHGIYYVGEAYTIHPRRRKGQRWVELQEFQTSFGLPLELDPIAAGWIPPYWNDPVVQQALNSPVFTHAEPNRHRGCEYEHECGRHYLGQVIAHRQGWMRTRGELSERQHFLRGVAPDAGLHAAMLIPAGWVPPEGEPQGWKEFFAEHHKTAEAERQRMQRLVREMMLDQGRRMLDEDDPGCIDGLEVSARAYNTLKNCGIRWVPDLVKRSESELLQMRRSGVPVVGRKTVLELQEVLEKHGLRLGMTEDDIRKVREAGQQ